MKITGTAIKLAATSLVLLLVTVAIIVIFGQVRFDHTTTYSAVFSNATGLREGQFVRAAGVEIGKVSRVDLIDRNEMALVAFNVESSVPLYESTTAQIRYADLIGNRYLELGRGDIQVTTPLAPGATIPIERTRPALDLDALIGGFRPLFRAMDPEKVNSIASSIIAAFEGQGGTIAHVLDQTAQLTATLADRDQTIGDVVDNLNTVLDTTTQHQEEFGQLVNDLHELIGGLTDRADPLADATAHISDAAGTLADLLADERPVLKDTVARVETIQQPLVEGSAEIDDLLTKLPDALRILARMGGLYGNFFNFYLCDLTLRLNGLQPGGPVREVKVVAQPSGRCTPQ
jgi:phospholipid/cholesterol/gamma-HCH transport system substrate-binding protein